MANEVFKLKFISNNEGEFIIDEPIGFDSIPFTSKQDDKRLSRDISFGGDKDNQFTFFRMREHKLDLLLYYFETFGWESKVELIIEKEGVNNIIGDLDFFTSKTDMLEYFKCNVIQR
ncbi:hypothetical protein N1F78_11575 [Seonamhaeicola sp. MEBiC1930]|uniref:hypothetical protein n=1 Tax=Seonamhaeicola sp. MEBiC01930 TaxID=2976768 RepID=UPI003255A757